MPAQTIDEVKLDLVKGFSAKIQGSKFYEDYAKIASYLSNPAAYIPALLKLEMQMKTKFTAALKLAYPTLKLNKANANDFDFLQKQYVGHALKQPKTSWSNDLVFAENAVRGFKKLLTSCLEANEREHDFNVPGTNVAIDIIVGLPAKFNDLLKDRRPFKDVGAGKEHGEHSHRIQWYLITQMGTGHPWGTLKEPAALIYEKLPGWNTKYTAHPEIFRKQRDFYMWEFLVDRDGVPSNAAMIPFKTLEQTDFRAPSNLNRWLISEQAALTFPFLNTCLRERWEKRSGMDPVTYFAKKALNNTEVNDALFKEIMDYILKNGILTRH